MYAVDTYFRVTKPKDIQDATDVLGTKPLFWGRYFSGIDYQGDGEYFRKENPPLHLAGIRVLPIGRYTTQVGLGKNEGLRDGTDQAKDVVFSFGENYLKSKGGEYYIFLDVESDTPLSTDYYLGWSTAVRSLSSKVKLLPCVYLNAGDSTTSKALNLAIRNGAKCNGLWVANYGNRFRKPSSPKLNFNSADASPATSIPGVPVLLWQYAGEIDGDFDLNVSNPQIRDQDILSRLILPPAG